MIRPPGRREVAARSGRRTVARFRVIGFGSGGRRRSDDGRDWIEQRGTAQTLLELEQLAHKVQIGRDYGTALLDESVRLDEREPGVTHQVRDGDGRRARDARVTMHQHGAAVRSRLLCK